MRSKKRKYKHSDAWGHVIFLAIIVGIVVFISGAVAKYIHTNSGENLVSAKEFYFVSNLLKAEQGEYVLNSNADSITFTLENHIDELRRSEVDIKYTVTVITTDEGTSPILSLVGGGSGASVTGTLTANAFSDARITLSGLVSGKTYTVIATGTAGYEHTISAKFTVSDKKENVYYNIASHGEYVLLTVWTENVSGQLNVNIKKTGFIPDNTDPVMKNVYNYSEGEYKAFAFSDTLSFVNKYSSHAYRFFVKGNEAFDVDLSFVDGNYTCIEVADIP